MFSNFTVVFVFLSVGAPSELKLNGEALVMFPAGGPGLKGGGAIRMLCFSFVGLRVQLASAGCYHHAGVICICEWCAGRGWAQRRPGD